MAADEDGTLLLNGQRVLQEDYDENYEPTEEDIRNYCKIIGMDYEKEASLLHIAVEALKAPLPRDWKPIESADGDIYYFNFRTKESSWEHPCDSFYKEQLEREREKIRAYSGPSRTAEMGQKGLDLLPGATGMLKAGGGSLFHNLPPLKSKPAVGSGKLAPLAGPLLSQVSAPGPLPGTGTGTPQSSYLKSGAGGGRGQPADSVLSQGVSRSPAADSAESVSPGLAYLKSPVQQAGLGKLPFGVAGSRSPASFQLGHIAAEFDEEEEEDEGSDSPSEEEVSGFEKKFNLGGIDVEESSDHEVSEEIARVTGRDVGKEEDPSEEGMDFMLQMKAYAERLDRTSPGALSPSTASPAQQYLKTPQQMPPQAGGAGGRQSELSSGKNSAVDSPRLQRPTSSYGRGGITRVTTGGGQMVQHHVIPTQSVNAASEGEREESLASSSLSEHPVARGSVISPPVSAAAPRWSSTKPRSPPESKIPIPQSMGRRGFPQRSSPKADSPGQVEDLEQALVTQTKMADLKKAHQEELDRLNSVHQKEVEQLEQKLKAELQAKEEELTRERDAALAETRHKLAAEQIKEERHLKAEMEKALEETRKKLQDEEDNEEAELHESKTNRVIKIKQQLEREQYREEGELRAAKEAALKELQREIQDLCSTEEDQIRKEGEKELAKLRESLQLELEQEKDTLREAHTRELEMEREKAQEEFKGKCVALSQEQEREMATVELRLSNEKEERLTELRGRMEGELEAERARLQDLGQNKEKAEEELQKELDAALHDKKKALIAENEATLAELRKEHSSKLEQCRLELQETHTVELDSLRKETGEAEQRLRQLKEQLEAEEQEHAREVDRRRKECQLLEEEVQEKTARLTAERSQLGEELRKVECEREKVAALQTASAEEAKQLMAQQQQELQEAIAQEKEALAAIKSSRCEAELGGQQAEEQKRAIESSLSVLRSEEEEARLSLQRVKEELQRDKQQLHKLKSEQKKREKQALKKQPKQTAVGVQVDLFLDPVEPVAPQPCSPQDHTSPPNFSTPKPLLAPVHAPSSADDTTQTTTATLTSTLQESNPSSPKAATLNYHDLTLASEQAERVEFVSQHPTTSKETRLQQPHQEDSFDDLHRHLDQEESAYDQAKAVVDKHRQRLAERKQTLRKAEQELAHDLRKVSKELRDTHRLALVDGVQASLKEEADSIREMEDQLSTSDQLLAMKKQKLKDIELSLMSNLEISSTVSCSDTSPSIGPTIPSPKTYLRTLQERLSRESSSSLKKHTHGKSRMGAKKHLFEPALLKTSSDTESSGVSSTHSLSSDSDPDLQVPASTHLGGRPNAPPWLTPRHKQTSYERHHMDALTASLEEINGKLWQVLDRLHDQTGFSQLQQLTRQGIPLPAAPTPYHPLPGHSRFVADQHKHSLHSSDRWAQPVVRSPGIGSTTSVEDEMKTRWNGYFSTSAPHPLQRSGPPVESIRGPVMPKYATPPRHNALSTEERLKKEKDWLKEFRRDVALSSSRRSAASNSYHSGLSPSADKPKNVMCFILDEHNNVQVVNQR